jgi:hypothetical protein
MLHVLTILLGLLALRTCVEAHKIAAASVASLRMAPETQGEGLRGPQGQAGSLPQPPHPCGEKSEGQHRAGRQAHVIEVTHQMPEGSKICL